MKTNNVLASECAGLIGSRVDDLLLHPGPFPKDIDAALIGQVSIFDFSSFGPVRRPDRIVYRGIDQIEDEKPIELFGERQPFP